MRPLKVGVVGAGAVGTYFGVRLAELGHDVRFLVRKRHDAPKKLGVTSWQGDFVLEGPTIVREASELGDDLDWVLVGLKSTALEQENVLRDLLEPCVAPNTRVQLLMNGLGAEEKAAEIVDARRVHGGLVYGGLSGKATTSRTPACPAPSTAARLLTMRRSSRPRSGSGRRSIEKNQRAPWPTCPSPVYSWRSGQARVERALQRLHGARGRRRRWGIVARRGGRDAAVAVMREVCRAANADLAARGANAALDEEAVVSGCRPSRTTWLR